MTPDEERVVAAATDGQHLTPEDLKTLERLHANGELADHDDTPAPPSPLDITPAPTDFPTQHLPPWVAETVHTVAQALEVPHDLPAAMALGVISTITTLHRANVTITGNYTETPNLYIVCGMPPGSGKSPAVKNITKPLLAIAEEIAESDIDAHREAEQEKRIADARQRNAEAQAVKDPEMAAAARQAAYEASQIVIPPIRQLIANDVTPEAFAEALDQNGGTLALISDEGGVIEGLGRYLDKGKPPNLDAILQSWSGGDINIRRKTSDAVVVRDPRATIAITAQPLTIRRMAQDTDFVGRGLLDRFLIAIPPSMVGERPRDLAPVDNTVMDVWDTGIRNIHTTLSAHRHNCHLDPAAFAMLQTYERALEPLRRPGQTHDNIVGLSTKMLADVARLATILHLAAGYTDRHPISTVTMGHAMGIADHYTAHAKALTPDGDHDMIAASKVIQWAARRAQPTFTIRDIMRSGVLDATHGRKTGDAQPVIEILEGRGWVRINPPSWRTDLGMRGTRPAEIHLHPQAAAYHERYATANTIAGIAAMTEHGMATARANETAYQMENQ